MALFKILIVYKSNLGYEDIISFKTYFYPEKYGDRRREGQILIVFGITGLAKYRFSFPIFAPYTEFM